MKLGQNRRALLEIIADVLGACNSWIKKTNLTPHCSMSFMQLEKYLSLILTRRLLVVENDGPYLFFKSQVGEGDFWRFIRV